MRFSQGFSESCGFMGLTSNKVYLAAYNIFVYLMILVGRLFQPLHQTAIVIGLVT